MTQLQRQKTDKEDVREITIINTIIILAIINTCLTSINSIDLSIAVEFLIKLYDISIVVSYHHNNI